MDDYYDGKVSGLINDVRQNNALQYQLTLNPYTGSVGVTVTEALFDSPGYNIAGTSIKVTKVENNGELGSGVGHFDITPLTQESPVWKPYCCGTSKFHVRKIRSPTVYNL